MVRSSSLRRFAAIAWAAPCSAVGLGVAAFVLLLRGTARRHAGALEVTFHERASALGRALLRHRYVAITLGHVVIAVGAAEMERAREHERVHVHQYERWGIAFPFAYLASSLWQWVRGRDPYRDNRFEAEAYLKGGGIGPGSARRA
jgi:Zn-dependent protease